MTGKVLIGADANSLLLDQTPIGFAIANAASAQGNSVVYISDDPRWGTLTLTLQNNTSAGIRLDAASTVLKLFVAPLLINAEIRKIELVSPDWAMEFLSNSGDQLYLELKFAAASPVIVAAGQTVAIQFKNVLASGSSGPGRFLAKYNGFKPAKDGSQRIPVQRQLPPDQAKDWPVTPGFRSRDEYGGSSDQGKSIYVTPWPAPSPADAISNNLVLEIETSETLTFGTPKPSIFVSFLSGDGEASLCSDDDITSMIADIDQSPGTWGVSKQATADLPVFTVLPGADTGSFDPAGGPLAIKFSNLISMLPPDKSSLIFVQCTGLSDHGYNDTVFVQFIDKVSPTPREISFVAYDGNTPVPQGGTVGYGDVTLKWDVFAAQLCLVEETGNVGKAVDTLVVPADNPLMQYHLQPQVGTQQFGNYLFSFNVTPPNVGVLTASPNAVAPGGASTLLWSCSNGASVQVKRGDGTIILDQGPLVGSCTVYSQSDTTYTLVCTGAGERSTTTTVSVPPVGASINSDGVIWYTRPSPVNPIDPNPFGPFGPLGAESPGEAPELGSQAGVDVITNWNVTVNWSTNCASSCRVVCVDTNETISTSLQGSWSDSGTGTGISGGAPRRFQIFATGLGTAQPATDVYYSRPGFGPQI
jgi:hypothetical protein